MVAEVEEKYSLHGLLQYHELQEAVDEFNKKHGQYPAKVILNPKHQESINKDQYFVLFKKTPTPAIEPLPINGDIKASEARGYHADVEYDEGVDEKTLICRGFAKLS